jgi:hypothetical protein
MLIVDSVEKPLFYHVIMWTDPAATVKMGAEDVRQTECPEKKR